MGDIPVAAELTIDYAMIDGNPDERMACVCGAPECRKIITGDDWRLLELQQAMLATSRVTSRTDSLPKAHNQALHLTVSSHR